MRENHGVQRNSCLGSKALSGKGDLKRLKGNGAGAEPDKVEREKGMFGGMG